jgi:ABC-type transport system involved in multi-copper enzyme maturation permease subunit
MFRRLFWKEWRENLWKLVFCGTVSLAFAALLFRIRLFPDSQNGIVISFIQMLVVPVVYALDIFSGEMSNRTIHLLFKFPVPRWKIFFSKYLVCILGMSLIFLATGGLMEAMGKGRETEMGFLLKNNLSFAVAGILLFTGFCGFGAQSRSEAGSLVSMFGVMIGWGIIFFWALVCQVSWATRFVPYFLPLIQVDGSVPGWLSVNDPDFWINVTKFVISQSVGFVLILCIACYRFVKVRRYL